MYKVETYELGLEGWGVYHEDNDPKQPEEAFSNSTTAKEVARKVTIDTVCLARVIDEEGTVLALYDTGEEYTSES